MTKPKDSIDYHIVAKRLDYCRDTGTLFWKGGRFAGRAAGYVRPDGYRIVSIDEARFMAHRLCWLLAYGQWPKNQIDHKNHSRDDNRLSNLRDITSAANKKHTKNRHPNGYCGVTQEKNCNSWRAQIGRPHKIYLGCFPEWWDAVCARKAAENKYKLYE